MGSALHEHMHMRAALGVDSAMERLALVAHRWALTEDEARLFAWRCRTFEWSPPAGAFGEVALCMREGGDVLRVVGGRGKYDVPDDAVSVGTVDVMWSEPEPLDLTDPEHPRCPKGSVLWVPDYKSGDEDYVTPIAHNLQAAGGALMAARWTGAEEVMPAIIFIRPGQGEWDAPEMTWGARECDDAEKRLRNARAGKVAAWAAHLAGTPLAYREGPWCQFCRARLACPTKIALIKAVANDPHPLFPSRATREQKRALALALKDMSRFVDRLREFLKEEVDADGQAIDLGNGFVWGPVTSKSRELVPKLALPVLLEELGDAAYDAVRISKGAVEDVVKQQSVRGTAAGKMRALMSRVDGAHGVRIVDEVEHRVHRADETDVPPTKPTLEALLTASLETTQGAA
jgi:hypothetical protein